MTPWPGVTTVLTSAQKFLAVWTCSGIYHGFFLNLFFCSTSGPLTIVRLSGLTVPMLKFNVLKLFSTMVVVLFFTSLPFTLPPLPDRNLIATLSDRRKFHMSDNVQVFKFPVSAVPDTSFWHTINPPQHTCIIHQATQPPFDPFLFWSKSL